VGGNRSDEVTSAEPGFVVALGVFGLLADQRELTLVRDDLRELSGCIPESERGAVASYLRAGRIVLAIMEYTRDVLDGRFGVSGGSAIQTDGVYYWRRDAADYVEHYGSNLPKDFLEQGRRLGWSLPPLTDARVLAIDDYLSQHIRRLPSQTMR